MVGSAARRWLPATSVLVPTLVAAVLVSVDLGTRSLWVDEGATFATVTQSGRSLWHWTFFDGGNMAAYYGLEHLVASVYGTGVWALRVPSALATVATVALSHELVRRLADRRRAFVASLLVAVSLPLVYWGQMARGYAIAICLLMAAGLSFVLALETSRRLWWLAFVAASVAAVWTIEISALVVLGFGVALSARGGRRELPVRALVVSAVAVVVLCAPLAVPAATTGANVTDWQPPLSVATDTYVWRFMSGGQVVTVSPSPTAGVLFVLTLVGWVAAVAVLVAVWRRHGRSSETFAVALPLCAFVLPVGALYLLTATVQPLFQDRYLLVVVPFGSILLAWALTSVRPAWLMAACVAGVLVLRVVQIVPSYGVNVENWRSAAQFVLARSSPHDCMALYENGGYQTFDYYVTDPPASRSAPRLVLPATSWSSHSFHLDPQSLVGHQLSTAEATCPTLWLVTTHLGGRLTASSTPFQVGLVTDYRVLVAALRRVYTVGLVRNFKGVGVVRYDRRPAATHD